jgi:hypothetical protein
VKILKENEEGNKEPKKILSESYFGKRSTARLKKPEELSA